MSAKPEHYDVIKKPVITEKATMVSDANAVVFQVAMDATKPQIKEAVEAVFGVTVARSATEGEFVINTGALRKHGRLVFDVVDGSELIRIYGQ